MGGRGSSSKMGGGGGGGGGFATLNTSGLPELEGSPKQIAWAEDIRRDYIAALNEARREMDARANAAIERAVQKGWSTESPYAVFASSGTSGFVATTRILRKDSNERDNSYNSPWGSFAEQMAAREQLGKDAYNREAQRRVITVYNRAMKEHENVLKSRTSAKEWIDNRGVAGIMRGRMDASAYYKR